MADKKISELDQVLQINNDAAFPMSQDSGGTPTTYKASITQIGAEIAEDQTFSNLQTTSKNLVGAINELLSLGNPIILGTSAPTSSQGENGNLYIQYTAGTGGADDEVDGIYVKINGAWCEIQTGGGGGAGGHTIVDDAGTSLTQRTNLQFNGAYSEDNSTDDTTEVNVVRSMTKAEFNQLSSDEKTGFINTTDEASQINATEIPIESGSATDTKSYIDSAIAVSDITSSLTLDTNYFSASTKQVYKSGNIVNICLRGSLTATNGAILGTIATYYPKASHIICDFHNNGAPTPITTGAVWLNGENGRMYYFGGSVTSLDVCITVTYICN